MMMMPGSLPRYLRSARLSRVRWDRRFKSTPAQTEAAPDNIFEHFQEPSSDLLHGKVALRGLPFAPGTGRFHRAGPDLPEYVNPATSDYPYQLRGTPALASAPTAQVAKSLQKWIAGSLVGKGAVLFRGLPAATVQDFQRLLNDCGDFEYMRYNAGGTVEREALETNVLQSTAEPPTWLIEGHNEMCYQPVFPKKIFFFCSVPPGVGNGGQTQISDSREIYRVLDAGVRDRFERKGIRYHRVLPDRNTPGAYMSWQQIFQTTDRAVVNSKCDEMKYEYSWTPEGTLKFSTVLPAVIAHPVTGEKTWFNQAHTLHVTVMDSHPSFAAKPAMTADTSPWSTTLGDGEMISEADLQAIRLAMWNSTVAFDWRAGDLLVLDNISTMHGRMPFVPQHPARKIGVTLADPMSHTRLSPAAMSAA